MRNTMPTGASVTFVGISGHVAGMSVTIPESPGQFSVGANTLLARIHQYIDAM